MILARLIPRRQTPIEDYGKTKTVIYRLGFQATARQFRVLEERNMQT
jgi:hypothetical protein